MVQLFLAESHYLIRKGVACILNEEAGITIQGQAKDLAELENKAATYQPDVLMVDYTSANFNAKHLSSVLSLFPSTKVLAITPYQSQGILFQGFELGVNSFLLKDCEKEEIIEAIYATANEAHFFCGKILEKILTEENKNEMANPEGNNILEQIYTSCDPVRLSEREMEIIRLVASGYTNKEIAQELFLSSHTVITHRKNIMKKLDITNTAQLVVYAVKERIIDPA